MELTEQTIAELRSLVEQIAQDQPTPAEKFLFEMIFGLCASGSVPLTEVGRKLPANNSLHAVEKRLSRQLGSKRWDDEAMLERYLQWQRAWSGQILFWPLIPQTSAKPMLRNCTSDKRAFARRAFSPPLSGDEYHLKRRAVYNVKTNLISKYQR